MFRELLCNCCRVAVVTSWGSRAEMTGMQSAQDAKHAAGACWDVRGQTGHVQRRNRSSYWGHNADTREPRKQAAALCGQGV